MENILEVMQRQRATSVKIHPLIHARWSPRSMSAEPISDDELKGLFEAARMAPSSYNAQPWRMVFSTKGDAAWQNFFDLLVDFNKMWCKNAAALILFVSKKTFEHNGKPSITHSYDTGAAWMSLALEGASRGLVVHGIQGFDYEKAAKVIHLPDGYQIEAMAAVGKRAPKENLPQDLQEKETPSGRRPLSEIVFRGSF